jgi:hypothetical protein
VTSDLTALYIYAEPISFFAIASEKIFSVLSGDENGLREELLLLARWLSPTFLKYAEIFHQSLAIST